MESKSKNKLRYENLLLKRKRKRDEIKKKNSQKISGTGERLLIFANKIKERSK